MRLPRAELGVRLPQAGTATLVERRRAGDELESGYGRDELVFRCEQDGRKYVHPVPIVKTKPTAAVQWIWCAGCLKEHRLRVADNFADVGAAHSRARGG